MERRLLGSTGIDVPAIGMGTWRTFDTRIVIVRALSAYVWQHHAMAKARQVRRALEKAGWELVRTRGSHRIDRKGNATVPFAYHDAVDLGTRAMTIVAREFGMTVYELRRLL